jgi:hypothetical protein
MKTWIKIETSANGLTKLHIVNQEGKLQQYYINDDNGNVYKASSYAIEDLGYTSVKIFVKHKKFKKTK